jgi:hypothetical protein
LAWLRVLEKAWSEAKAKETVRDVDLVMVKVMGMDLWKTLQ